MMKFRKMRPEDKDQVLAMMKSFYASPALLQQVSEETMVKNIDAILAGSPYLDGYVFTTVSPENYQVKISGYSIIAKSWSTEAGGPCIWIEDLYFKQLQRHKGNGTLFLNFVKDYYGMDAARLRLEVEPDNANAIGLYKKVGYKELPYIQMVQDDNEMK